MSYMLVWKMRNFAWVVLIIATIPVCLARKAGALGAVATTGEDDRLAVTPAQAHDPFHRVLDPLPGPCCGLCTQLIFNPQATILMLSFDGNAGGMLNPSFLPATTVITIIVRHTVTYTDNTAADPSAIETAMFDIEVRPEHWNPEPCTYTNDCVVFENEDIMMFAPPFEGGFGAISLSAVDEFNEDSDVNVIHNAYDLRCAEDSFCDDFEPTAGALDFGGVGVSFGVVQQAIFYDGFCFPNLDDDVPCEYGTAICGDPHMIGLRGQTVDVSGVDGGWYCLIRDDVDDIHVNIRLTAPLPIGYPHRQLITGLAVISGGHSLTVEIKDPYSVTTDGCPGDISPCLADGGVRISVDGEEVQSLLAVSRTEHAADGIYISASNLPVECQQFGGDKIWASTQDGNNLEASRRLVSESFEDWVLSFDAMAAPEWCAKYIAEQGLAYVQSNHAVFKIETPAVSIRLNTGVNHQGEGDVDWDGSALPEIDFWQMDVGFSGLSIDHMSLSGLLGETARPVLDGYGRAVMTGDGALRGKVEDYRVSAALGTEFSLQSQSS